MKCICNTININKNKYKSIIFYLLYLFNLFNKKEDFMNFKKIVLIFTMIVLFASVIAVSASTQQNVHDMDYILQNFNESDMTGCCSVALQLDGNNSIMTFRRDSESGADIYIEKVNWFGKEAVKQYKTTGGYFCQVIVTSDGWTIGYGGIDDGVDNEKIENLTGKALINNTGVISESLLSEVAQIKGAYGLGHMLIKAPDGSYGVATANNYFTGKLGPNDYISVPNREGFIRTGTIEANTTDKVSTMMSVAQSDGFGVTRRDITSFVFTTNETENKTNAYLSNDDGAMWGMGTSVLCDNVNFLGNVTQAGDIPIAPSYKYLGNVTFIDNTTSANGGNGAFDIIYNMVVYSIILVIVVVVAFISYHVIRVIRYRRRYRR